VDVRQLREVVGVTITVYINGLDCNIPRTVETVEDVLVHADFAPERYDLFRTLDCESCGHEHACGPLGGHIVVGEGDQFDAIPKTTTGGGD
jgi:hypothetical protein